MENNILDIAIIGGGPGGIASAVETRMQGIENVILFEKGDGHSMTLRKFYKDNKRVDKDYKGKSIDLRGTILFSDGTKETTLDLFDQLIEHHDINVRFNTEVDRVEHHDNHFEVILSNGEKYQARYVILSIGKMGRPNRPSYPIPAEVKDIVNFDANSVKDGEKILVVGGGNSAAEYVCVLCETTQLTHNHRGNRFSKLNEINYNLLHEAAQANKFQTKWGVEIVGLENDNGKPRVLFADNTAETFDRVVYAIGGVAPINFLKKCNINLDENGVPIVNSCHESSIPGMYIAGDILYKSGGSIGEALNHGFRIAECIASNIALDPDGSRNCHSCRFNFQ